MKRSREEEIVFGAFQRAGCEVSCDVGKAIADGLRQIRRERYEERVSKKESYKGQKRNHHVAKTAPVLRSGIAQGQFPFGNYIQAEKSCKCYVWTRLFNEWVAERA